MRNLIRRWCKNGCCARIVGNGDYCDECWRKWWATIHGVKNVGVRIAHREEFQP